MVKRFALLVVLFFVAVHAIELFKYTAPKPPATITAYRTTKPIEIDDGDLDEEEWTEVPFTPDFVELSGSADKPKFKTNAKVRFDDNNLYVGILIEEPYPAATLKDGYIWKDNSIGIYFDAAGSSNLYNQFDINAYNAVWSAVLVDTYKTNINLIEPYVMHSMQRGVAIQGHLNDPTRESKSWSIELAFPFHYLTQLHDEGKPKDGSVWRMLISRAQWGYKVVNGTWVKDDGIHPWYSASSPQWQVSTHHPENYNFLQFTDSDPKDAKTLPYPRAQFETQQVLLWLQRVMATFVKKNGKYAENYKEMDVYQESLKSENGADRLEEDFELLTISPDPYGYACSILHKPKNGDAVVWSIRDDFKMWKTPFYANVNSGPHIAYGVAVTSILFNVGMGLLIVGLSIYIFVMRRRNSYSEIKA